MIRIIVRFERKDLSGFDLIIYARDYSHLHKQMTEFKKDYNKNWKSKKTHQVRAYSFQFMSQRRFD